MYKNSSFFPKRYKNNMLSQFGHVRTCECAIPLIFWQVSRKIVQYQSFVAPHHRPSVHSPTHADVRTAVVRFPANVRKLRKKYHWKLAKSWKVHQIFWYDLFFKLLVIYFLIVLSILSNGFTHIMTQIHTHTTIKTVLRAGMKNWGVFALVLFIM